MAFSTQAGPSSQPQAFQFPGFDFDRFGHPNPYGSSSSSSSNFGLNQNLRQLEPEFDILDWYPKYQSCHRYFLTHAQHNLPVQALSAFLNIQLPYQKDPYPVISSAIPLGREARDPIHRHPNPLPNLQQHQFPANLSTGHPEGISLVPYIRRLVATGHDTPDVLHGFFGDDWIQGIGKHHEVERRNFLFASKSQDWQQVKQSYDMPGDESCPFLAPLTRTTEKELKSADEAWSKWLAQQDWMLGPRTPDSIANPSRSPKVKREPQD